MSTEIENVNPEVYDKLKDRDTTHTDEDDSVEDPIDQREVFDIGAIHTNSIHFSFFFFFFLIYNQFQPILLHFSYFHIFK